MEQRVAFFRIHTRGAESANVATARLAATGPAIRRAATGNERAAAV